jgi:flagellar hook protein FlgE
MSLSASLNAGVQGLSVNSTRLSAISDNIVNANTNGYKRVVTEFSSIAIESDSQTSYTAGGVRAYVKRDITAVGTLEATNSATDIAVSGAGFFAVSPVSNPNNFVSGNEPVQLASTGSFAENAEGFLKNANGDFLLGWALNPDGTTVAVAPSRNTFNNLTPVNARAVKYNSLPTSEIRLSGPLPASATKFNVANNPIPTSEVRLSGLLPTNATTFGANVANNTVRYSTQYFNSNNTNTTLEYVFTPKPAALVTDPASNQWDLSIIDSATVANGGVIGKFNVTFDSATGPAPGTILSVTPVTQDLDSNPLTPETPVASATYNATTGVINLAAQSTPITTFIGIPQATNGITQSLAATTGTISLDSKDGRAFGADIPNNIITHTEEYYDTIGNTAILKYVFTPMPASSAGPASDQWDLSITDTATTTNGGLVGRFTVTFDGASGTAPGTILSVAPVIGDFDSNPLTPNTAAASATYDNVTGVISLQTGTSPIETFIGIPQTVNGLTQTGALSNSNIRLDYKDGSGYGEYKGVEIDPNGIVRAYFSNDQYRPIYQVPIVTVANPNALEPVGGQAYSVTAAAGNIALVNSGEKLAGKIIGYALTKSTVDVAQELTQLIETQRAYASNAKIIQTVDEMLQETTNIKR